MALVAALVPNKPLEADPNKSLPSNDDLDQAIMTPSVLSIVLEHLMLLVRGCSDTRP